MKKYRSFFIFLLTLGFVALPALSLAVECGGGKICNPISSETFDKFIDKILTVVIQVGATVLVFFIVYSGFLFVSARGNEEQLKKAKTAILWTVIGGAILLGAKVLEHAISQTITDISK
jgi:hypothetical protein